MIEIGCTLLLALSHALPWLLKLRRPISESPEKIFAALSFATTVPYYLLLATGTVLPSANIIPEFLIDSQLNYFAVLYSAGCLFYFLGVWSIPIRKGQRRNSNSADTPKTASACLKLALVLYLVFLISVFLKFDAMGGVFSYVENIDRRGELTSGTGVYEVFIQPTAYLPPFFLLYSLGKFGRPSRHLVWLICLSIFVLLALFGGRKLPLYVALFTLLGYSFYIKKIRLINLKTATIIGGLLLFFVYALQFRGSTDFSESSLAQIAISGIHNTSYIDTYLFAIQNFDSDNYWLGVSFLDLYHRATAIFIDSGLRPPIDEGVYLRTQIEGVTATPPISFEYLYPSSWPPESFGNGYINFGPLGVFLFFFIKGLTTNFFFRKTVQDNFTPWSYFLFLFVAFNFHVTNLRIIQLLTILTGVWILKKVFLARKFF